MDNFKIGEIVIVTSGASCPEFVGTEAVVVGGLEPRLAYCSTGMVYEDAYLIKACDGSYRCAKTYRLRRKPPADDGRQVTHWADCPWQPDRLPVT